ncbi:hypothetical protein E3V55_06205 [Candidatus Marinimicrobia bacterium MT.SAG.3]|nr:hypothetical protein E3V55_06205 [Candidatus Marinimicrobia bacterium MT.SAG.3]
MMINDRELKIKAKGIQRIKSFVRTRSLLALTIAIMLAVVACGGGGLTEEQLQELEETKTAALSAEAKIQERKVTKKELSENLALKKKELKQLLADKELLKKRLKDLENLSMEETDVDTSTVDTSVEDASSEDNGDGR